MSDRRTMQFMLAALLLAGAVQGGEPGGARFWAGGGMMAGETTYRIGGEVVMDGETTLVPDTISELKWPMNVAIVGGGLLLPLAERAELRLQAWGVVSSDAGTAENRDWLEEDRLTIYSESDAELSGHGINGGLRYWFDVGSRAALLPLRLGAGIGLLYHSLDWEAVNLDQSYPLWADEPHDRVAGVVGTYGVDLVMPFIEAALQGKTERFCFTVAAGVSPYVSVHDEDDHLLRAIYAETDATGVGGFGSLAAEFSLGHAWFLLARLDIMGYYAEGTEHDRVYAGPDEGDTWTIDHEIESLQQQFTIALGLQF